jgi:hypothetical protein
LSENPDTYERSGMYEYILQGSKLAYFSICRHIKTQDGEYYLLCRTNTGQISCVNFGIFAHNFSTGSS